MTESRPRLAARSVDDALAAVASRGEHDAGGAASAITCAAAAALVELTARLAADRLADERPAGASTSAQLLRLGRRATQIRERVLGVIDDDRRAVAQVRTARGTEARLQALVRASESVLTIAESAAELAEAAAKVAQAGSWSFSVDAVLASELAASTAKGSASLVAANLADAPTDRRILRARQAAARAARARDATPGLLGSAPAH